MGVPEHGGEGLEQAGEGRRRRPRRPLDQAALDELALAYVARFATSRAKLAAYLGRKVKERGWESDRPPDLDGLAERLTRLGFIDDRAFAEAKSASLLRRGYGRQRVRTALQAAGIEEDDRRDALTRAEEGAVAAALRFAERRRIGPYATSPLDPPSRNRALAAMIRAGHGFELARRIVDRGPGEWLETED